LSDYSIWNLKQTLAPMTWPQRFEYLLTYYKWVLGVVVAILFLISIIVTVVGNARTEILLSGVLVNAPANEECYAYLTDGCLGYLNGQPPQAVELTQADLIPDSPVMGMDTTAAVISKIVGMISMDRLDYIITDEQAYDYFLQREMYADLRAVLPESELAVWQEHLVYNDQEIPVAIDLSGTGFSRRFLPEDVPYYLLLLPASSRHEACCAFLTYLK